MRIPTKLALFSLLAIFILNGCKKESSPQGAKILTGKTSIVNAKADSMVLTPRGWLPKSHVYYIENGYQLLIQDGQVLKVHTASGKIMANLGEIRTPGKTIQNSQQPPSNSNFRNLNSQTVPGGSDGWVAYSVWGGSTPITYFSTAWAVPGNPTTTSHGQTIFIFNALSQVYGGGDIMQPVLQWGSSASGGGNYWGIANWYGWTSGSNLYFAFTNVVSVSTGTSLVGIINNTGTKTDGSYNWTVGFTGFTNSLTITEGATHSGSINGSSGTVTFPFMSPELYAFETIETYNNVNYNGGNGVVTSTDYPTQLDVPMTVIKLYTNGTPAALSWTAVIGDYPTAGEHTNIINNNSNGSGEVDLYFHPQPVPPAISYPTPQSYYAYAAISPLTPTNTGGAATSYSVSPALPSGLSLNTSTGVISGTPSAATAAANYTVTATNAGGSSSFPINITVTIPVTYPITFYVATTNSSITNFILSINTGFNSGPRGVSLSNPITVSGSGYSSNSTVVMQVTFGYMPVSAVINGFWGHSTGVISGNTITFSGVNLSTTQSVNLNLN